MPGRRRGTVRSLRPLRTVRSCGSAVLSHQAADPHCAREPASALRGCSPLAEGGTRGQRVRSYTRRPRGESPPHGPSVKARMSPRGRPPLPPLPCCDARARAPTGSWSRRLQTSRRDPLSPSTKTKTELHQPPGGGDCARPATSGTHPSPQRPSNLELAYTQPSSGAPPPTPPRLTATPPNKISPPAPATGRERLCATGHRPEEDNLIPLGPPER